LEYGETTLEGGIRELQEETEWDEQSLALRWHPHAVCSTDSIGEGYQYLIAHCFAELTIMNDEQEFPPQVKGADDAADAGWFTIGEIQSKVDEKQTTPGVLRVIQRMENLSGKGLLPTTTESSL